jgi:fatty acid desaturase|tara:strand:- start:38 stop:328 length:291 start_codon:yes stop_codon:yes gene_type:complete
MRKKGINPMELTSEQARIRRRKVLFALVGVVVFTLLLAIVAGGGFIAVHLFSDTLLFGYVLMLVQYQREVDQSRQGQYEAYDAPNLGYAATGTESL